MASEADGRPTSSSRSMAGMPLPELLWRHRSLAVRLARREIAARFRGSLLGPLWAVAMPLLLLTVYAFVFGTVLKSRWPLPTGGEAPFALVLLSGLVLYQFFAETLNTSPSLIRTNQTFVKQVVFPLEILPVVTVLVAGFNAAVSAVVLALGFLVLHGLPPLSAVWLPLVILPLPLLALGCAWFLASIGTFLRDTAQLAALLTTILMFLSPIFYAIDAVPEPYRPLLWLNPLSIIVVDARAALFMGEPPRLLPLAVSYATALVVLVAGAWFFRRTKHAFIDVL